MQISVTQLNSSEFSVFETQGFSCSLADVLTSRGALHGHFILWPCVLWGGNDCDKQLLQHVHTCVRGRQTYAVVLLNPEPGDTARILACTGIHSRKIFG